MATENASATGGDVRRHVIVVDADIEPLRKLVASLRSEYEFHLTISAGDALALLERYPVAAIVAAQKLFSSSGLELLAAARRRSPGATRILVADASDRKALEESSADAGLFQVLQRPCTTSQLKESLHAAVRAADARTEETGEVEHVVMETLEERPQATDAQGVPLTVLTTDAQLFDAITAAVHGKHDAYLATRLEDAGELAATGRCPVLITDQALAKPALERITRHLHTNEPALVTIAVGTREQGNALMGLLSTGQIHRFLLKPVTPGLARLAIDSASRHHLALKGHPKTDPLHPPARHEPHAKHEPPPKREAPAPGHAPPAHGDTPAYLDPSAAHDPVHRLRDAPGVHAELPHRAPPASKGLPGEGAPAEPVFEFTPEDRFRPATSIGDRIGARIHRPTERNFLQPKWFALAAIAVVVAGAATWWALRDQAPPIDPTAAAIRENLAAAQKALDEGRFVAPPEKNAAFHYRAVLASDPKNVVANAGLDDIAERFIEQAETLIVEGKLEDAQAALDGVRTARPQHRRLRFLDTQLRKEQQDRLVLRARESAGAGDTRRAQQLLEEAARVSPGTPGDTAEVSAARATVAERERDQSVTRSLEAARQRVAQGRLVAPDNDSAKFHLRAAQRLEPDNIAVQQGLRDLGSRAAIEAQRAIDRGQLDTADDWITEAAGLNVPAAELAPLRQSLEVAVREKPKGDLLQLVLRRTDENRLLEPANDNARYYLDRLKQVDAQYPGVQKGIDALGARLVANAQAAIAQRQFDTAANLLTQAREIGYAGAELATAETVLRTASAPTPFPPKVPVEIPPKRIKYVAPVYPRQALERGTEGWVDVTFGVTTRGDVIEVTVERVSRRNMFESAAINAVRQWKFEPRPGVDPTYTQRVKMRVEFKLTD